MTTLEKDYLEYLQRTRNHFYNIGNMKTASLVEKEIKEFMSKTLNK